VQALGATIADMAASTDLAAYRAADAAFHRSLAVAARNTRLGQAAFHARADLFFPVDRLDYQPTVAATVREHTTIARAIERSDVNAAARAVTAHLEHTRSKLRSLLDVAPPSPVRRRSKGAA
jgi:DNA-binding GntR family transcriptional regulator